MDKREMIERALEPFYQKVQIRGWKGWRIDSHALAEQAIVIECEVEHGRFEDQYKPVYDKDVTYIQGGDGGWALHYNGHIGTPGKTIAIIVLLGEE